MIIPIVKQLRAARAFRKITATELAKRVGIRNTYISCIERGHTKPSSELIERIAEALDMQVLIVPKSI